MGNKKKLLNDMMALTKAQTPVIKIGSLDELEKLIAEKQRLIELIDKLDAEFGVHLEKLKAAAGIKKLDELDATRFPAAKQLKRATSEVLELVREISDTEKINSVKGKELLEQLGSQINKINQGKIINNAYNKPNIAGGSSFFVDKKK